MFKQNNQINTKNLKTKLFEKINQLQKGEKYFSTFEIIL